MASASSQSVARDPLSELITKARARKTPSTAYQGDVTPLEAFQYIAETGGMLVDVRTLPEWQFVGMPDVNGCKRHGKKCRPACTPSLVRRFSVAG
jgi:hypothetical protein